MAWKPGPVESLAAAISIETIQHSSTKPEQHQRIGHALPRACETAYSRDARRSHVHSQRCGPGLNHPAFFPLAESEKEAEQGDNSGAANNLDPSPSSNASKDHVVRVE